MNKSGAVLVIAAATLWGTTGTSQALAPQGAGPLAVGALYLGRVTVGVGYTLFWVGLRGVPVAMAATLTLAEPLTAGKLGVLVLGERLSLAAGLGIGLILVGLVVLSVSRRPALAIVT